VKTNPHVYDAISSVIDGVDQVAKQMEAKWGVGRLELLVDDILREKFRRQQRHFDEATKNHDDVERVRQAGAAMKRGYEALDAAAAAAGATLLDPEIWEVPLSDGRVVAFCRTMPGAFAVYRAGRYLEVWTIEEVARLIEAFPEASKAKEVFPGAIVTGGRAKLPPQDDREFAVSQSLPAASPKNLKF
jgi:hypothetical protein